MSSVKYCMINGANLDSENSEASMFIWKKKFGLQDSGECSREHRIRKNLKRQIMENRKEIELKRKCRRRDFEKPLSSSGSENSSEFEQRYSEKWLESEETFFLNQVKERSKIRLSCGRPQAIDLLANFVNGFVKWSASDYVVNDPLVVIQQLNYNKLLDLQEDVKVYQKVDGEHEEFWKHLSVIIKNHTEAHDRSSERLGVNTAVKSDVWTLIQGKSMEQLIALEKQIKWKMKNCKNIDISYWEHVLKDVLCRITVLNLTCFICEKRQKLTLPGSKENDVVKQKNTEPIDNFQPSQIKNELLENCTHPTKLTPSHATQGQSFNVTNQPLNNLTNSKLLELDAVKEYTEGQYSPEIQPMSVLNWKAEDDVRDAEEDWGQLMKARLKVIKSVSVCPSGAEVGGMTEDLKSKSPPEQSAMRVDRVNILTTGSQNSSPMILDRTGTELEIDYWNDEPAVPNVMLLADSDINSPHWRPQKPKFHNRVISGFFWTKYNKTHYDRENPPPKTVLGYKFIIFYPNLMDKSKPPQYDIIPCDSNGDDHSLAIVTFKAGPPYQDIAFKIVNKEWDYSKRKGFRCEYERGTFYLWFKFKRYAYRR